MRPAPLVAAALAAALLIAAAPAAAQDPATLVVVETASVRAAPDTAAVAASVTRRARTGARARRLVERKVAAVLRALDRVGVPRANVRTEAIESYRTRRKGKVRHVAVTALRIRTHDLDRLGALIGALRGTEVSGPEFSVADSTAARQEATRIALARARTRADAAAAALGQRVIAIRTVDLNPEFGYDPESSGAVGGGDDESGGGGSVIVEPGEEEVAVAVAVVYEIGP